MSHARLCASRRNRSRDGDCRASHVCAPQPHGLTPILHLKQPGNGSFSVPPLGRPSCDYPSPTGRSMSDVGPNAKCRTFERDGRDLEVKIEGSLIVNEPELAVDAALDGLGLAYVLEGRAAPFLADGRLVRLLADWTPPFP